LFNFGNTLSVLLNKGDGTFAAGVVYATGSDPQSLTIADFNSDGRPDLATANHKANTISVLLNNGNGTFADKVDYAPAPSPYPSRPVISNATASPTSRSCTWTILAAASPRVTSSFC